MQLLCFIIILVLVWVLQCLAHFMCYKYVDNSDDKNDTFLLKLIKFCFYPQCLLPLPYFLFYLSFHFFPENQYGLNCIIIVKTQMTNKVKNRNYYNLILVGQIFWLSDYPNQISHMTNFIILITSAFKMTHLGLVTSMALNKQSQLLDLGIWTQTFFYHLNQVYASKTK